MEQDERKEHVGHICDRLFNVLDIIQESNELPDDVIIDALTDVLTQYLREA